MTENKSSTTAIVIGIVALLCCICVLVAGMAGIRLLHPDATVILPNNGFPCYWW
jgi:Na+/proline symporter